MRQDKIYYQEFSNGDRVFAKILGVFKNGNFKALHVDKHVGRKAQVAKRHSIFKTWASLWKEAVSVPADVLKRFPTL